MGGCVSAETGPQIVFNLDIDVNNEDNKKILKTLTKAPQLLQSLQNYNGCDEYIKEALSEPSPETEKAAWKAVVAAVDKLYKFYKYSQNLEECITSIISVLSQEEVTETFEMNVILLAKIFDFAFHFDEKKMVKPAIQNDFSYYRRVLGRMKNVGKKSKKTQKNGKVDEDIANKMSFYFAYPTPVMKSLIDTVVHFQNKEELVRGLALIANVACKMIGTENIPSDKKMLLLCVMTGCIIFIDHLEQGGVFKSKSPVKIYQCINTLKNYEEESTDFLLNSLRFSTITLSNDSTLPSVKKLLS